MPIAGRIVLRELTASLDSQRESAKALRAEELGLARRVEELGTTRTETIASLAKAFLPELSRSAVARTWAGVREELLSLLEQQERRLNDLGTRRTTAEAEDRRLIHELAERHDTLEARHRERVEREAETARKLSENQAFQERSQAALAAEQLLHDNEDRLTELQQTAAEKLPAYESSRLFCYLWQRKYGTDDYKATGWTLSMDRWVARLIDYPRARKSYEFLKEVPQRMHDELARRKSEFADLMAQIEELRNAAAAEAGLTATLEAIAQLEREREAAGTAQAQLRQQLQALSLEVEQFQRGEGQLYEQALRRFQALLDQQDPAQIARESANTPSPHDDELSQRLAHFTRELSQVRPRAQELAVLAAQAERLSSGLESVVAQYHQAGYDGERSYFEDDFEVNFHVDRFRKGLLDSGQLWQAVRQRQKTAPSVLEQTAEGAARVIGTSMNRTLLEAIVKVAGVAVEEAARRSVDRRQQQQVLGGWPSGGTNEPAAPRDTRPQPGFRTSRRI